MRRSARDPEWMRLALWVAQRHNGRPDREDIRQEALLGAWKAVEKVRGRGLCSENRAAVQGAQWAVGEYLRLQVGGARCCQLATVSLEELQEREGGEWEPAAADGTAALLTRLDLWGRAAAVLTRDEYDLMRRLCVHQENCLEIAARRGRSPGWAWATAATARRKLREAMANDER